MAAYALQFVGFGDQHALTRLQVQTDADDDVRQCISLQCVKSAGMLGCLHQSP